MIVYKDIPEYPGYRAGSDGTIWSCWKVIGGYRSAKGVITNGWKELVGSTFEGRRQFRLKRYDGKFIARQAAHYILLAFVGPCPDGMEACHNDGNCSNDYEYNLRWDTPKNNKADMVKHGTQLFGEDHHCAKITDEDMEEIAERRAAGEMLLSIAEDFNITRQHAGKIARGIRK